MSRAVCAWAERDEILEGYVRDALGPEDRDAFEAHYFECAACFEKVQTFQALHAELVSSPAEAPAAPAAGRSWRWVFAPVGASLLVVAAAALWLTNPPMPASPSIVNDAPPAAAPVTPPATPPTQSASPAAPALQPAGADSPPRAAVRNSPAAGSGVVLLSPAEDQALPADAPAFRWQRVSGAIYYDLQIVTEEGNVAWSGKAAGTTTTLPPGHGLQAGTRYFVWVRAHLSGGGTVKSPAVPFHVGGQ